MKTFTDEDGQEWFEAEGYLVPTVVEKWLHDNGLNIFKPVKQESKWHVGEPISMENSRDYTFFVTSPATSDQAQLIKDWISEGMGYVMGEESRRDFLETAIEKARQSMRENN